MRHTHVTMKPIAYSSFVLLNNVGIITQFGFFGEAFENEDKPIATHRMASKTDQEILLIVRSFVWFCINNTDSKLGKLLRFFLQPSTLLKEDSSKAVTESFVNFFQQIFCRIFESVNL